MYKHYISLEPQDNLWFFFAGHGRRYADRDYLMFLDSSSMAVERTAISIDYVTERLRRWGADNVVLLIDACRDEGDRSSGLGVGMQEHKGVITFYSCAANQKSWEIDELQHGSFTYSLLEGLRTQGETNCATVERLDQHLRYRVPQLNAFYKKFEQNPALKAEPPYKMYYILVENSARIKDTEPLKYQASQAEIKGDLSLAKQLWIRILSVSRGDWDAIEAIERLALRQVQSVVSPITQPVALGGRSVDIKNDQPVFQFDVVTVNAQGQEIKREQRQAQYFSETLGEGITLEMVAIPGGTFTMGSPKTEAESQDSERPQHQVIIKPFYIGKYQVTQAQWRAVAALPQVNRELNPEPSNFKGDERPVEKVSWYDAVEFCDRLTSHTGKKYSLPSEAQWEYACRAGTTTPFHFGKTITSDLADYNANFLYGAGATGIYRQQTTYVGSFGIANAFGLYDMHGNVWEWCLDDWHSNYQGAPTDGNPWFNDNNNLYQKQGRAVLRGGSWYNAPKFCRSASRYYYGWAERDDINLNIGFRVVCAFGRILQ